MTILLILNHAPYDGTDLTWNALRLAGQLKKDGAEVRLFLMNDSGDLARDGVPVPEGSSDLVQMTKNLIADGATVKGCGTCQARCGIRKGEPFYEGARKATMAELSQGVLDSEQVPTF